MNVIPFKMFFGTKTTIMKYVHHMYVMAHTNNAKILVCVSQT